MNFYKYKLSHDKCMYIHSEEILKKNINYYMINMCTYLEEIMKGIIKVKMCIKYKILNIYI